MYKVSEQTLAISLNYSCISYHKHWKTANSRLLSLVSRILITAVERCDRGSKILIKSSGDICYQRRWRLPLILSSNSSRLIHLPFQTCRRKVNLFSLIFKQWAIQCLPREMSGGAWWKRWSYCYFVFLMRHLEMSDEKEGSVATMAEHGDNKTTIAYDNPL